jgi:hypothetical protein
MNLLELIFMLRFIRFSDTFLFTVGSACFIGGFFTNNLVSYFVFGACFGLLIKHAIEDFKNKK